MNDLLVTCTSAVAVERIFSSTISLAIKDLDIASRFLGMRIALSLGEQEGDINDFLRDHGLENTDSILARIGRSTTCHSRQTPSCSRPTLAKDTRLSRSSTRSWGACCGWAGTRPRVLRLLCSRLPEDSPATSRELGADEENRSASARHQNAQDGNEAMDGPTRWRAAARAVQRGYIGCGIYTTQDEAGS